MKKIAFALGAIYVVINETTIFQFDFEGSPNKNKVIVRKSGILPSPHETFTKEQLVEYLEGKKLLLEGISQEEIESFLDISGVKAEYFLGTESAPIEEQPTEIVDEKPVDELPLGNPDGENENKLKSELTKEPLGETLGNDDDANAKSETDEDATASTAAATTGGSLEDESGQTTSQDNGPNTEISNTTEEVDGSKDFQGSTNL